MAAGTFKEFSVTRKNSQIPAETTVFKIYQPFTCPRTLTFPDLPSLEYTFTETVQGNFSFWVIPKSFTTTTKDTSGCGAVTMTLVTQSPDLVLVNNAPEAAALGAFVEVVPETKRSYSSKYDNPLFTTNLKSGID